jgi:hypothetical protein
MRKLFFLGALLSAASITASCFNPQPDPPQPNPPNPGTGGSLGFTTTSVPDAGSDADPCPDWMGNVPGEPCNVAPTIECGGNAAQWASYCFVRCCGGTWLGPSDVTACGLGAPPCP